MMSPTSITHITDFHHDFIIKEPASFAEELSFFGFDLNLLGCEFLWAISYNRFFVLLFFRRLLALFIFVIANIDVDVINFALCNVRSFFLDFINIYG